MASYIPTKDADFNIWYKNQWSFVSKMTTGAKPEWTHISPADLEAYNLAYEGWFTAWEDCSGPHTSVETLKKVEARKAAEKAIRLFKHRYIDYRDEVTDAQRVAMGFKPRDTSLTHQGAPTVRPDILIENTKNRYEQKVRAINPETGKTGKPEGAHGVCYAIQVGGQKPASGADIAKTYFSVKSYRTFTFTEAQKGLPVYYSVCYENRKGEKGPWSPVDEGNIG